MSRRYPSALSERNLTLNLKQSKPASAVVRDPLCVAGLFAGIGGFELGLRASGHEASLLCEIDGSANAVLDERFPGVRRQSDICAMKGLPTATSLLTAGFPCQDLSQAGLTRGIEGSRSGLIGEVFRLLQRKRVEWLLIENVPFMLRLAQGRALEVIIGELERLGYRWAYRLVNTRAFGLPQRRIRVFILASRSHDPKDVLFVDDVGSPGPDSAHPRVACGFYWTEGTRGLGWAVDSVPTLKGGSTVGIPSPPAILMPDGSLVRPDIRDAERLQGFAADWTLPVESITRSGHRWKLVGNAVTVDVAQWIGRRLVHPGEYDPVGDAPLALGATWPNAAWGERGQRHRADVSEWPEYRKSGGLEQFLAYPTHDLSEKATAGFLSRARSSTLRFPDGFLDAVENHLQRLRYAGVKVSA